MERKLPGKFFRKFGNSFRGWSLFWKFWKMLFHSLTEVVANSKPTFWLISQLSSYCHWVAVVCQAPPSQPYVILFWLSLYVPTLPWLTTCFKYDQNHHFTKALLNWHYSAPKRSLLTSLFTFFLISIRLNSKKSWPYIWTKCKSWKIWLNWAICAIFSSIQVILKDISAIKNCEIALWQKSWWAIHSL